MNGLSFLDLSVALGGGREPIVRLYFERDDGATRGRLRYDWHKLDPHIKECFADLLVQFSDRAGEVTVELEGE